MMMNLRRLTLVVVIVTATVIGEFGYGCYGNVLTLNVKRKFAGREKNLTALRAHDVRRHGRLLSTAAVDLPLGGNGQPSETGLYFAEIGLGNPSQDYYVQVDTGSDILWVNCAGCDKCPTKSDLGIDLTLYDPKRSSTSSLVYCDQDFCTSTYDGQLPGCKPTLQCQYNVVYGDGSSTAGYFVKDNIQLEQVTNNLQSRSTNGTVVFGCGARQSGELGSSSEALDGILGFGQANSSIISQLAASGKVKRMFAHCLDNNDGGGIFAIGEVVSPKVKTTPMVPNQQHYNVVMKDIEVGGDMLQLPSDIFDSGDQKGTIVDSGTTLAYLPSVIYDRLMKKILSPQPSLQLHTVEDQFTCFQFVGDVDDGFPVVKFHFEDSLVLTIYPHDYLFQIREDVWCFGWQNSGMQSKDGRDMILLGVYGPYTLNGDDQCVEIVTEETVMDGSQTRILVLPHTASMPPVIGGIDFLKKLTKNLVLSNKLVVYDLENQTIGWTEYNCSSSIKVKDDSTGVVYSVGAHDIASACSLRTGGVLTLLLSIIMALLL